MGDPRAEKPEKNSFSWELCLKSEHADFAAKQDFICGQRNNILPTLTRNTWKTVYFLQNDDITCEESHQAVKCTAGTGTASLLAPRAPRVSPNELHRLRSVCKHVCPLDRGTAGTGPIYCCLWHEHRAQGLGSGCDWEMPSRGWTVVGQRVNDGRLFACTRSLCPTNTGMQHANSNLGPFPCEGNGASDI